MKILIETTWGVISEINEDGTKGNTLMRIGDNPHTLNEIMRKILTPSQFESYALYDRIVKLSLKKQNILKEIIATTLQK